jgi:TetR/AcrR family transcriptional regulator, regulator of cefoperazone and chloramphenicol sensitivity
MEEGNSALRKETRMNTVPTAIETRIIEAAIECIEKFGIQATTNRKIAEMAGVNNASINYYFRSKDVLINRCMQVTLENAFDFKDFERLPGNTARERCAAIFNDLIVGGIHYPGVVRAHFFGLLTEGKYDSMAVKKLNGFVQELANDLMGKSVGLDPQELQMACVQVTSAVMMAILAPQLFKESFGMDMADEETRERFVERLVERLL